MTVAPPKVFISYSHDSDEHAARVLKLANELRRDGVSAIIDQYFTSPPEGWPAWMDEHIHDDDFVIMVCTETYYRRVMRKEKPAVGHGVAWEGSLIYNHIYRDKCDLSRFLPVLLNGGSRDHIPAPLFGATCYLVETPRGYNSLLRHMFKRPEAKMPDIGKQPTLPQHITIEPTPPAEGAVSTNGVVDAPVSLSVTKPASEENKWSIKIEATYEDILSLIPQITHILRERSEDVTLLIKRLSPGCVIIELECSNKAGLKLYRLIADGKLTEILGYKVHSIAIGPLIAALHDPDESVRKEAARILGKLGDSRAVEPLIAVLKDDKWEIRWSAAYALGNIRDARALQPLIEALKDDDKDVRWAAADALGNIGTPALQPLIEALKDDDKNVRWSAAYALGNIRDARAVQPLIEALKDDDKDVRRAAADVLGEIGNARAVQPLIEALKDDDKDVRRAVDQALRNLGSEPPPPDNKRRIA